MNSAMARVTDPVGCGKYLMPEAWGRNVWHSILDDAVRMRAARAQAGEEQS